MSLDRAFGIAASLVTVAAITTVVSHKESAGIIKAFGDAFKGSLLAAQGIR